MDLHQHWPHALAAAGLGAAALLAARWRLRRYGGLAHLDVAAAAAAPAPDRLAVAMALLLLAADGQALEWDVGGAARSAAADDVAAALVWAPSGLAGGDAGAPARRPRMRLAFALGFGASLFLLGRFGGPARDVVKEAVGAAAVAACLARSLGRLG